MKLAGKLMTLCTAGAILAACGGDKKAARAGRDISYTGSTTALVISQDNVPEMTALASSSATGSVGSASGGTSYTGAVSADRRIGYETALAVLRKARRDFAVAFAGAYQSATQSCPGGGTMTVKGFAASDTLRTAGDWTEMSVSNCDDGTGVTVNGTMRVDITATDGADPSDPTALTSGYTYGMRLTVTDFSVEDANGWIGIEGDMQSSELWNASTFRLESSIQGGSLVVAAGVGSTVTESTMIAGTTPGGQFSMTAVTEYADAFQMTEFATESGIGAKVCSTGMNGCILIETAQAFRQLLSEPYPASGSMTVSDGLGHYIEIVPTNGATGAVTVSWEIVAGDPTPDGTCNTTWATMAIDTCFP